jgi:hypothetical protein
MINQPPGPQAGPVPPQGQAPMPGPVEQIAPPPTAQVSAPAAAKVFPPSPPFTDLSSRLPVGIQMLDVASRSLRYALGTLEFISHPAQRAALQAIADDVDSLINDMSRKIAGGPSNAEQGPMGRVE